VQLDVFGGRGSVYQIGFVHLEVVKGGFPGAADRSKRPALKEVDKLLLGVRGAVWLMI
jgi:hypothetical protein